MDYATPARDYSSFDRSRHGEDDGENRPPKRAVSKPGFENQIKRFMIVKIETTARNSEQ